MARRGHGEGSIYRRKDGRYAAAITLENRKRKTFYGKTRKEVQDKLNTALHEHKQGMLATGPQQLLKVYLEQWLEQVYKPSVKPNSYKHYSAVIRTHLIPSFGHIPVQKLTAAKVQAFYTQKLNEGAKPRTVIAIHAVLHRALEDAVKWGLVPRNVTKLVSLPHAERYEAQTLTVEQASRLLETARGSRIEALLLVAITTGMRRGELLALHWDDVDLEKGVLYVRRTMSKIVGYGYKESEPKTRTGRRKVVLPGVAMEALKEHRLRQDQARLEAGEKWHERGSCLATNTVVFLTLIGFC